MKDLLMLQQHREEQLNIVEQQKHAKELGEQAMQELRDEVQKLRKEQESLREEQEKMKGNEQRKAEKMEQYVRTSAELVKREVFVGLCAVLDAEQALRQGQVHVV